MKRKLTVAKVKKQAWDLLSKIIRLQAADDTGYVRCVSCGVVKHWKAMQAGHFLAGRRGFILFDERGIHPQCGHCNVFSKNAVVEYFIFMQREYGQEVIDELRALKHKIVHWNIPDLKQQIEGYKERLEKLQEAV